MLFITTMQTPRNHRMTLEELFYGVKNDYSYYNNNNTVTYIKEELSYNSVYRKIDINGMMLSLLKFSKEYEYLKEKDRKSLYYSFAISKKTGGLRHIDAPNPELMTALRNLKSLIEEVLCGKYLYHTNAYAYIGKRSTVDALKKHQRNESKWFAKLDLSNFFGSIDMEFLIRMLKMIYPFCLIMEEPGGEKLIRDAFDLAFLDGVLPQGTPLSPMLTNIIMIPIDAVLTNKLKNFDKKSFVYTRYADDFLISCKYDFDINNIVALVKETINEFNAPLVLNNSKTRYGSSAGQNWNLGLMLNKENKITVGHVKKKHWKSMAHNYIADKKNGISWSLEDIQHMEGVRAYISHIEPESMDAIIGHINHKHNCDFMEMVRADLRV